MPDVFHRKRLEIVFLEEIIGAEAKKLEGNTNMAAEVKPVQHMHTRAAEKKFNEEKPWLQTAYDYFNGVTLRLLTIFYQYQTTWAYQAPRPQT